MCEDMTVLKDCRLNKDKMTPRPVPQGQLRQEKAKHLDGSFAIKTLLLK